MKPQSTSLRACSACAGDYEDPEQTAWSDTVDEDEGDEEGDEDASAGNAEQSVSREGFPAREL